MTSLQTINETWNLDALFPGGSASPDYGAFLDLVQERIAATAARLKAAFPPASAADADRLADLVEAFQEAAASLGQAGAFASCLVSQDVNDKPAQLHRGRIRQLSSALGSAASMLESLLIRTDDSVWQALLTHERLAPLAAPLNERRRRGREKFPPEIESLVGDLNVDGYHAWGQLYDTIVGRMTIEVAENGQTRHLSMGQAHNLLSSGDRRVRAETFRKWEGAWGREADLCAEALNHLGGYRLALYKHRGWDSILKEPLENNRMTEATLNTMWETVERNKPHLVRFLERKAKLMGLERLTWHDVDAPLTDEDRKISYAEGATEIVEQFGRFNPALAEYAAMAFREGWIEAENRPGKKPGAFHTSFPLARQSRIFMTYAGTRGNVATLAHELGHGYHSWVMRKLPYLARGYSSNVAETASTFAEMILADAALQSAASDRERVAMLADKVERAIAFCMNLHCRFLFETRFYAERRKGLVPVTRLNELMLQAQKEAYLDSLGEYHPHFWASKLHFYITGNPFYNWPYTFGFLFSAGLYARAVQEGPSFAARYDALLLDTGRTRVEELAQRHLDVDLTQPEFWQGALDLFVADVDRFLELTK